MNCLGSIMMIQIFAQTFSWNLNRLATFRLHSRSTRWTTFEKDDPTSDFNDFNAITFKMFHYFQS